ncbi:MAG: CRISPR-associated endonuclease Cas2 [Thermodesulfobium sp.]
MVAYDSSDDRVRLKISQICFDHGLERLQYSVFTGAITVVSFKELRLKLADILEEKEPTSILVHKIPLGSLSNFELFECKVKELHGPRLLKKGNVL